MPNPFPKSHEPEELRELREEFGEKTSDYFAIENHSEKDKSKKKILAVIQKLNKQQQVYIKQFEKKLRQSKSKKAKDDLARFELAQEQWNSFENIFKEKTVEFFSTKYFFPEAENSFDIYCLFYEKGFQLLNKQGLLSFITSNKWMRAGYGKNLRKFFAQKTKPLQLIDFGGHQVFETATVDTKYPNIQCRPSGFSKP